MLTTRPPPQLSSSMEVIPKRFRSNSISSRLRSASELFDEGIVENRQQKGVLKDLIIREDERLTDALARYEKGDKETIRGLLREGVLNNRKSSLDLLGEAGDLNFDFLSVSAASSALHPGARANLDIPFPMDDEDMEIMLQEAGDALGKSPAFGASRRSGSFSLGRAQMGFRSSSLSSIPGVSTGVNSRNGLNRTSSAVSVGTPPPDLFDSFILDEAGVSSWVNPSSLRGGTFGSRKEVLDFDSDDLESPPSSPKKPVTTSDFPPPAPRSTGSNGQNKNRKQDKPGKAGTAKDKEANGSASATSAPIVIPRPGKQDKGSATRMASSSATKKSGQGGGGKEEKTAVPPPAPMTAEERMASRRAQGVPMVGAYSPDSRKLRVERFVAKRDRRVWKKKVKYDVRKNFADSRLRVKGRFVKKEDEEMLRDLMTMV